jgi:hypothetical protein
VLGPIGAILGLPAAAMIQGIMAAEGERHEVIDDPLVKVTEKKKRTKKPKP